MRVFTFITRFVIRVAVIELGARLMEKATDKAISLVSNRYVEPQPHDKE